jgi:hypothetical protein
MPKMERRESLEPQISRYFTLHGRICQQNSLWAESARSGVIFKLFPEIAADTRKSAREPIALLMNCPPALANQSLNEGKF